MNNAEQRMPQPLLIDELMFALQRTLNGQYADAQSAVARVKSVDPRNIYVIALEKQIMRLERAGLSAAERTDALETLPGLVERAHTERERRLAASGLAQPSQRPPIDERESRLRELVNQYFEHADEWVKKADYASALQEIRRVLLVDPENRIAREYERKIEQLKQAKSAVAPMAPEESSRDSAPLEADDFPFTPIAGTNDPEPTAVAEAEAPRRPARKKKGLIISVAAVAMVAVIVVFVAPSNRTPSGPAPAAAAPATVDPVQTDAPAETKQEATSPANATETIETPVPDVLPIERQSAKPALQPSMKADRASNDKPAPVVSAPSGITVEPSSREIPVRKQEVPTAQPVQQIESRPTQDVASTSAAFIPVEKAPRILRLEQPSFSEYNLSGELSGEIRVKVQIDKDGKPLQAMVISSTNNALNARVVDAVMKSTYEPGVMSNGPVVAWMVIPFKFK